jgi:hypothetical protein
MSDHIEKMRELVEAKKQKNAGKTGLNRAEKNLVEKNMKVTKQHKKGGLFDGK